MVTFSVNRALGESSNPFFSLQWMLKCWFSRPPGLWGFWTSRLPQRWGEGMGIRQATMQQNLPFLSKSCHFSWIVYFSDCFRHLANFQSSEKVDLDNFASILFLLLRRNRFIEVLVPPFPKPFPLAIKDFWFLKTNKQKLSWEFKPGLANPQLNQLLRFYTFYLF